MPRKKATQSQDISYALSEAVDTISQAAKDAVKTITDAAAVKDSSDHDLLIELKTKMDGIKADIKDLGDGTSKTIADHETRIRTVEKALDEFPTVKKLVYGAAGLILVSVLSAIVYLVVSH